MYLGELVNTYQSIKSPLFLRKVVCVRFIFTPPYQFQTLKNANQTCESSPNRCVTVSLAAIGRKKYYRNVKHGRPRHECFWVTCNAFYFASVYMKLYFVLYTKECQ